MLEFLLFLLCFGLVTRNVRAMRERERENHRTNQSIEGSLFLDLEDAYRHTMILVHEVSCIPKGGIVFLEVHNFRLPNTECMLQRIKLGA